ncbi:MAG TPA: adenylate/guanylate cyclase domain-containing protein [Candidatus Udaeobacter sp.]|jgi:tetratricopeptide (TPR) repeat protein|nr:adenylate/guanylate cyclase domain-containing protein [Candidatus Udaeobacter sp.]
MSPNSPSELKFEIGHVLYIDIVGYSKLNIREQSEEVETLKTIVRGTEQFKKAEAEGKLLRLPTGDGGALVFRTTPETPVLCALEIAKELKAHPEIKVRMGIHSGPVNEITDLNEQANIAGAGINTAQRVMDFGDAGHILVSRKVAEDLEHYPRWQPYLHWLGECEVKNGGRIDVINFYHAGMGNPQLPNKFKTQSRRARARRTGIAAAVVLLGIFAGAFVYSRSHQSNMLTDKGRIVLADFTNTTGDSVFDATLRQGLASQLEQTPFLSLISDSIIAYNLTLMSKPRDARLTPDLAREVGQRVGAIATIEGSIAALGTEYVVSLKALNCRDGNLLAQEQETATGKEHVLSALGQAATKLRKQLGESLASVQKYDALPQDTTTSSLEALQAYALGNKATDVDNDYLTAITFFQRAVALDPNFAMAYLNLGGCYQPQGELILAAENTRKAYALRERTSDHEKLNIQAFYEIVVTGNLEAARRAYELVAQTYPHDETAQIMLWYIHLICGDYARADAAAKRAFDINPDSSNNYVSLMYCDQYLGRLDQAKAAAEESRAKKLNSPWYPLILYVVAFLENNRPGMTQQASATVGVPGVEDQMFFVESETAADHGQFGQARELTRRAVDSARRAQENETAAEYEGHNAVREALVGLADLASKDAQSAISSIKGKHGEGFSAIAFALAGDISDANQVIEDLTRRFPQNTVVQTRYLPMARAALALNSGNAQAALDALTAATAYELGHTNEDFTFALYPIYLRGRAYLGAKNSAAAAGEFQKILDHAGIVGNEPIGALARLGLGRAYSLSGDAPKAKSAYQDFFALWKNADPDVLILKQAKAEYAKLQ